MDQYQDIKAGCDSAREAAKNAALQAGAERDAAIRIIADRLLSEGDSILEANRRDAELAEGQLAPRMIERMRLDETGLGLLCHRLLTLASAPDPLGGEVTEGRMHRYETTVKRVPLGAVAFAYDCRPQVTALAVAACIKTANAALLAPGFATSGTDAAIIKVIRAALRDSAYSPEGVVYIDPLHKNVPEILSKMTGTVDLLVLNDGALADSGCGVPVIDTGRRVGHVYIDKTCDIPLAVRMTVKSLYPPEGAREGAAVVLVHGDAVADFLPALGLAVQPYHPELRGCPVTREYLEDAIPAVRGDWVTVHGPGANVLPLRVVESMEQAIVHINTYSTAHADAIMTRSVRRARQFEHMVDSRVVCVNTPLCCDVLSDGVTAVPGIEDLRALTRKKYLVGGVSGASET